MLKKCQKSSQKEQVKIKAYFYIVNLKNIILAYFLILSYTLSFAHSLIPHSEGLIDGQHIHDLSHEHNHSHSKVHSHSTDDHVIHADHFDENIYDYLICIFSDLEHGESECSIEHEAPTQEVNVSFLFVAVFYAVSNYHTIDDVLEQEKKERRVIQKTFYSPPQQNAYSLRGPPSLI